jgi:hypothetical protein
MVQCPSSVRLSECAIRARCHRARVGASGRLRAGSGCRNLRVASSRLQEIAGVRRSVRSDNPKFETNSKRQIRMTKTAGVRFRISRLRISCLFRVSLCREGRAIGAFGTYGLRTCCSARREAQGGGPGLQRPSLAGSGELATPNRRSLAPRPHPRISTAVDFDARPSATKGASMTREDQLISAAPTCHRVAAMLEASESVVCCLSSLSLLSRLGNTPELRSSKTMESKRPLAHAISGMAEGWGEGCKAFGASYFRRRAWT